MVHASSPSTENGDGGGSNRQIPDAHWTASVTKLLSFRFRETLSQQINM